MELASADGKLIVDAGDDRLVGERLLLPTRPESIELRLVALEQRRELVETRPRRAAAGDDVEIGFAQARLHRVDVDVLQELRLQQLAYPRDLVARLGRVDIGEKPVRPGVGGIEAQATWSPR